MVNYEVKDTGGKKILIIDAKEWKEGVSIAESPEVMARVVNILMEVDADVIVLSEVYDRIYDEKQTKLLKEVADVALTFEKEGFWSLASMEEYPATDKHILVQICHDLWMSDPIRAYLRVLGEIKRYKGFMDRASGEQKVLYAKVLKILLKIKKIMETTRIISTTRAYIAKLKKIPESRKIYAILFQPQLKPSFIGSRLIVGGEENLEILDQYSVGDTEVTIYKHPDKVEPLYHISPPEYMLTTDKYFIMEKAKEVVAKYSPERVFISKVSARQHFIRLYQNTIKDIADSNGIRVTREDVEFLSKILARYTIGYGILEILLMDKKITDIYLDAPLGMKPVYINHSIYGQCQTNVVFSEEEAKTFVSKLRAMSGRPFDEVHPVLDYDLPDMNTRVAVIGPPLSPDGIAFAFRLHKPTPWTLPQFIDVKMLTPLAAGLLSFLIDAQTTLLIAGSRGSGKTSLMTALILEIPINMRIITQEDTLEIPVEEIKKIGFNIQRLKTKSPIGGGSAGELPPEDALRTALRLGDSAIVVGEVRSVEARVLYEAMRVGAAGNVVMGTIHGDSAYSVWDRVVNDLQVPSTSFKATDLIVVNAPIRFSGSLKRVRRTISITEVKKHWASDPLDEGGFLDLMLYDAKKDKMELLEDNIKDSDLFSKIMRLRGIGYKEIWKEINARTETKRFLVEIKRKYNIPELLEGKYTVRAHNKFLLLKERCIEELGAPDYEKIVEDWKKWVKEALVRELISKKK